MAVSPTLLAALALAVALPACSGSPADRPAAVPSATPAAGAGSEAASVPAAGAGSEAAPAPAARDLIAFRYSTAGRSDLYTVRPDGTVPVQVTHLGDVGSPAWAPDGRRLIFTRGVRAHDQLMGLDVWTVTADGSRLRRVVAGIGHDRAAAWAPDGSGFVYAHHVDPAPPALILHEFHPHRVEQLTFPVVDRYGADHPSWSPDAKQIAFEQVAYGPGGGRGSIYAVRPHGRGPRLVARDPVLSYEMPHWAPDGSSIAFLGGPVADRTSGCHNTVYLVDPDGAHLRRVPGATYRCVTGLSWSPDGRQLVVAGWGAARGTGADTRAGLWLQPLDGSSRTLLVASRYIGDPAWSPAP